MEVTLSALTDWSPLKPGDTVWVPVTDHPNFPKVIYEGESYTFRDRAVAERIAVAWNSYTPNSKWPFYAKSFILLQRSPEPEPDQDTGQLSLF